MYYIPPMANVAEKFRTLMYEFELNILDAGMQECMYIRDSKRCPDCDQRKAEYATKYAELMQLIQHYS